MGLEQALANEGEAKANYNDFNIVVSRLNYEGVDLPDSNKYTMYVAWKNTDSVAWPREDFVTLEGVNRQLESYEIPPQQLDWYPVVCPDEEQEAY